MAADDLNAPLRRQTKAEARFSFSPLMWGLAACAFIVASVAGVWIAAVDDPDGGWPVAVASMVAAGLAGSDMWRTGIVGMQLLRHLDFRLDYRNGVALLEAR